MNLQVLKFIIALSLAILCCFAVWTQRDTSFADYATDYIMIERLIREGDSKLALEYVERFKRTYPERVAPYFFHVFSLYLEYQKKHIQPDENARKLLDEIVHTGQYGVMKYRKSEQSEKDDSVDFLITYAMILDELGVYNDAIKVFEELYDFEKHSDHPKSRYALINYANTLSNLGNVEGANKLYIKTLEVNEDDFVLAQGYIKFNAEHRSEEVAVSFAIDYMEKMGVTADVKYQLCFTYEQYKNKSKAESCYKELLQIENLPSFYLEHARLQLSN